MTIRRQSATTAIPLHDPARMTSAKAAERAAQRHRWDGMTPAEMCRAMDLKELRMNARRGGVAAIAELERRVHA